MKAPHHVAGEAPRNAAYLEAWHALEYREPGEPGYGAGPDDPARFALPPMHRHRRGLAWVLLGTAAAWAGALALLWVAL